MALQISEIGVRLAVGEPVAQAAADKGASGGGGCGTELSPQQIDDLVRRCVGEVLATLRLLEGR